MKKQAHNKTDIHTIHEWCEQHNIEFLDREYINNKHKHNWRCKKHNAVHAAMWDKVKTKGNLKCCSSESVLSAKEKRVYEFCTKYQLTLVGTYKDSQTPTTWRCNVHNETHSATRFNLEHSRGKLPCCRAGRHGHTLEHIKRFAEERGWEFLDDKYRGTSAKHRWLCRVHNQITVTRHSILAAGADLQCCHHDKFSGPNHPSYNRTVSDDQRVKDRRSSVNKMWRQSVVTRDNHTCQKCFKTIGDTKLNAHHIWSYLDNPHLRTEVSNGITLCVDCHKQFHRCYGKSNNTLRQLLEFMNSPHEQV